MGKCTCKYGEKIGREPGRAGRAIRRQSKSDPKRRRRKLGGNNLGIAIQFRKVHQRCQGVLKPKSASRVPWLPGPDLPYYPCG